MITVANVWDGLRRLPSYIWNVRETRWLLMALLLVDGAFILLHVVRVVALKYGLAPWDVILEPPKLALDKEGGYAENWQYAKALLASAFLFGAWMRSKRGAIYAAWAFLFAFAALDDGLALHERSGAWLAIALDLPRLGALQPHDFGELLFAVTVGTLLLAGIIAAARWSAHHHRARGWLLLFPIVGLAGCGIGFDMLHSAIGYSLPASYLILTLLEDGGELLFMSLGCALALATFVKAADLQPVRSASGPDRPVPGLAAVANQDARYRSGNR